VFSYAAKWLFEDEIIANVLTPKEATKKDDERIVREIWKLIDEADIVVTYNGDHFDFRKMNTRFVLYQLPPPSFYRSVDLYKVAKDNFSMTSNKLSFVNTFLGIEDKTHTTFDLWKRCWNGEQEALTELVNYNCNDSKITEMLYLKILPWIKNHPNIGLYNNEETSVCSKCGGTIVWDGKFYYTQVAKYDTFRCSDCGSIGRSRYSILEKDKKKSVVV
jgi:DNA polymerase elongation subunit (family B)